MPATKNSPNRFTFGELRILSPTTEILHTVAASVLLALALQNSTFADSPSEKQQKIGLPNIVLILADDLGYGDPGCYNAESKIPTPCLDELAGEGMRFTDAHTSSAVCSPTRYSLLTGRYAWRTEMKKGVLRSWDRPLIKKDRLTLPAMLGRHGYHTACIGKWHLGWEWKTAQGELMPTSLRIAQAGRHSLRVELAKVIDYTQPLGGGPQGAGFHYYFGDDVVNLPPYVWIENNRCITQPTEPLLKSIKRGSANGPATPGWEQKQVLPRITKQAVDYIHNRGKHKDKPFFLYFPLTAPHLPLVPNDPYLGKSTYGAYGDFVHQVDAVVGEITKALDATGVAQNTLLIFTSDNGSFASPKAGHRPNGMLRGKKSEIFEGGHRVPFLVRWEGRVSGGAINRQLVGVHDIMATIAAIVGYELPETAAEDSISLLPTLCDATKPARESLIHHSVSGEFAIRSGDWKLITDDARKPKQLFDMRRDLQETKDLRENRPEVVKRLTAELEHTFSSTARSVGSRQDESVGPRRDEFERRSIERDEHPKKEKTPRGVNPAAS